MPGRTKGWRRPAALLALFSLLINVSLPLALPTGPANAAGATPYASSVPGETVVICTGAGMIVMQLGPDGEPLSGKQQGDGFCPLCTMGASIDLIRSIQISPAPDAGPAQTDPLPTNTGLPRRAIHAVPSAPRAPPLDI